MEASSDPIGGGVVQHEPHGIDGHIDIDTSSSLGDNDSTLGSDSSSVDSASITSSIVGYRYENGRRYHAYRDGTYLLPNDEAEQDRLDLHHHIFRLMLGGKLFRAPINHEPHRVLDFGTGTGIWAMDFADEHPSAFVIGIDLSPIQPKWIPPNCKFYVDDLESEWIYRPDEAFDYIHGRSMSGCIGDWDMLWQRIYTHLKPGGWVECQEFEGWIYSADDPKLEKAPAVKRWLELLDEASSKFGKKLNVALEQKQKMIDAGFVDIHDDVYKIPIGPWAKDPKLKALGLYQREHMILCVESYTLALATRILGWSYEECQVLFAGVKNDFRNRDNHLVTIFHFYYGQKPE